MFYVAMAGKLLVRLASKFKYSGGDTYNSVER